MADRTVSILLKLKDDASGGFKAVGKAATVALGAIGAAAGTAVVGIGAAALNMASDTKQAMNNFQAELGVTASEAQRLGDVALKVFGNNFGENVQGVGQVVSEVRRQLGEMSDGELQQVTENAFKLADVFEIDTAESLNAVKSLTEEFGMTSQQAFDFITTGFQKGLNSSDDFLDSIGEYSNLFADSGFDAGQFFSIMQSGAKGGVLGTDKIADSIKEMGIILTEGGDDVTAAFDAMGFNFERAQGLVASGDREWSDYFQNIVSGLMGIEDPIERQRAQVAIFGTMAEDLGVSFTEGLSDAITSMDDMAGATDTLDAKYKNLGSMFESVKRKGLVAIQPLGMRLMEIADKAMPKVEQGLAWFSKQLPGIMAAGEEAIQAVSVWMSDNLPPAIEYLSELWTGTLQPALLAVWEFITSNVLPIFNQVSDSLGATMPGAAQDASNFFTGVLLPAFQSVVTWVVENVPQILATMQDVFGTIAGVVGPIISEIVGLVQTLIGEIVSWVQANFPLIKEAISDTMGTISTIISTVLGFISEFWQAHGTTITNAVTTIWGVIKEVIIGVLSAILGVVKFALELISGRWDEAWTSLQTAAAALWEGIKLVVQTGANALGIIVKTAVDKLPGVVSGIGTALSSAGKTIMNKLWEGLKEVWSEIASWFESKLQGLTDMLPFSEPKDSRSPLRGLSKAGEAIGKSLKAGMQVTMSNLPTEFSALLSPLGSVSSGMPIPSSTSMPSRSQGVQLIIQGPLVGSATIRSDDDLTRLASLVAEELAGRVALRGAFSA